MTTNAFMIELIVWVLLGLIALVFTIPSVSSYLLEKITGIKEEENFDLQSLVRQKQELFKIQGNQSQQSALIVAISLSQDPKLHQLLQEYQWEKAEVIQELLLTLSEEFKREISNQEFRIAFKELLTFQSIDQDLSFNQLKLLISEQIKKQRRE